MSYQTPTPLEAEAVANLWMDGWDAKMLWTYVRDERAEMYLVDPDAMRDFLNSEAAESREEWSDQRRTPHGLFYEAIAND